MELSDFGTEKGKLKFCRLTVKTFVSCSLENKCYFERSNLGNGDIIFKSPKTRDNVIRRLKESTADFFCGK